MNQKLKISIVLLQFAFLRVGAQQVDDSSKTIGSRWQVQVGSGLYLDLFYANLSLGDYGTVDPVYYSDKKGSRIKPGKIDRFELKYFNKKRKAALSLSFQQALIKDIYGNGNDPLEAWKEIKRYEKRIQFSANYYQIYSFKKSELQAGLGFLVSGSQTAYPFYRIVNGIAEIGATNMSYFYDPGLSLNVHYLYKINKALSLGGTFYTYYLHQIGFEGASLQGSIAINF